MLLLDIESMIDVLRRYPPALAWLTSLGAMGLALPGSVVMELTEGCRNRAEHDQLERTLTAIRLFGPQPQPAMQRRRASASIG
jgi:predicted nucleic acid-binding protein